MVELDIRKNLIIMKVLHICTTDSGGAGLCCLRIHQALLNQGIDSKVLVMEKSSTDPRVAEYGKYLNICRKVLNKLLRIAGLEVTDYNRVFNKSIKTRQCFTIPSSWIDISTHPLVKNADIIHLHWINNFVDYDSFFNKVHKPFVWTLHDENLFLGICHYQKDKLIAGELETKYRLRKIQSISQIKDLGIVFLSSMMYEKYCKDEIIFGRKTTIINNAVDYHKYHPIDKRTARKHFGISEDNIVLGFVSAILADPRKGLDTLVDSVIKINNPRIKILAVGEISNYKIQSVVQAVGTIHDAEEMSMVYSCSDFFVMPSLQEAFAQTPLEAMSCGIPVVVFPVSGTKELITKDNGIICHGFTSDDLKDGILKAMSNTYQKNIIRNDIIKRFSPKVIADQYVAFFKKVSKK